MTRIWENGRYAYFFITDTHGFQSENHVRLVETFDFWHLRVWGWNGFWFVRHIYSLHIFVPFIMQGRIRRNWRRVHRGEETTERARGTIQIAANGVRPNHGRKTNREGKARGSWTRIADVSRCCHNHPGTIDVFDDCHSHACQKLVSTRFRTCLKQLLQQHNLAFVLLQAFWRSYKVRKALKGKKKKGKGKKGKKWDTQINRQGKKWDIHINRQSTVKSLIRLVQLHVFWKLPHTLGTINPSEDCCHRRVCRGLVLFLLCQ